MTCPPSRPRQPALDRMALMQTFVRIVEAGSLSAAAAQLGTTQPTVSRRLQALERSLGLPLLQRSTHRMKLTEDGERCFERAKELLANLEAFDADMRGTGDQPEGTLRVVVPHAFGQQQLVGPLQTLSAALSRGGGGMAAATTASPTSSPAASTAPSTSARSPTRPRWRSACRKCGAS